MLLPKRSSCILTLQFFRAMNNFSYIVAVLERVTQQPTPLNNEAIISNSSRMILFNQARNRWYKMKMIQNAPKMSF